MASWRESLYRMYKSGSQSVRVAVYGCKHDASVFEELLKDMCSLVRLVGGGVDEVARGRTLTYLPSLLPSSWIRLAFALSTMSVSLWYAELCF